MAQGPRIGEKVPDFALRDLAYYTRKQISSQDLRGKWFILDFFSSSCSTCFELFSETNSVQREFKDRLQVFLIGMNDKYIKSTYEKFRKKKQLDFPVTYDSALVRRWGVWAFPYTVWIDNEGIVKAITTSDFINAANVRSFLAGENFVFNNISRNSAGKRKLTIQEPLLIDGNGGSEVDFTFRSLLAPWTPDVEQNVLVDIGSFSDKAFNPNGNAGMFQVTGTTLWMLYQYAFAGEPHIRANYGQIYNLPVIQATDSGLFDFDFLTGKNIFSYSAIAPPEKTTRESLMRMMQRDLQNYFPYDVAIEIRTVPYWSITAPENGKYLVRSKSEKYTPVGSHAGYEIKGASVQNIIFLLRSYHQHEPPFIDESGIDFKFDIRIDALMMDLEDVLNELRKQGLSVSKKKKQMPAIVFRDQRN